MCKSHQVMIDRYVLHITQQPPTWDALSTSNVMIKFRTKSWWCIILDNIVYIECIAMWNVKLWSWYYLHQDHKPHPHRNPSTSLLLFRNLDGNEAILTTTISFIEHAMYPTTLLYHIITLLFMFIFMLFSTIGNTSRYCIFICLMGQFWS